MPVESNVGQFPSTKALICFVALVACPNKSVAAAASAPKEAVASPPALDARSAAYISLSEQRYLRSTSNTISNSEERLFFAENTLVLKSIGEVIPVLASSVERVQQVRFEKMFTRLHLNKEFPKKLLASKDFRSWVTYVEKAYPQFPETLIYSILLKYYREVGTQIIDSGLLKSNDLAKKLQVQSWIIAKYSAQDVFNLLKLEDIKDESLFEGQVFSQLASFVSRSAKYPKEADDTLYELLQTHFEAKLGVLLAKSKKVDNPDPAVYRLQKMQLHKWKDAREKYAVVYDDLGLKADTKLFTSPSGITWLDCMYLLNGVKDSDVFMALELKFGPKLVLFMLGAASKEGALGQRVKTLQDEQFGKWMEEQKSTIDVAKKLVRVVGSYNQQVAKIARDYVTFLNRDSK